MNRVLLLVVAVLAFGGCSLLPRPPWNNADSGDGWRLVASGVAQSEGYVVRVATDEAQRAQLTQALGLDAGQPVDFQTEIVASFGHGIGSSCPEMRLDDVVIDRDERLVFSVASDPLGPRACTADLAGGAFFVVALERAALPESPFEIRLLRECLGEECTDDQSVTVELTD